MKCGMRVVRGPDWKWSDQDGGQGHLGTVIGVFRENRTCMVQWDVGKVTECRAGGDGQTDLRIFDNAQTGVQQDGFCDSCQMEQQQLITGLRWKCLICNDFDLCTSCYMMDKHDKTHSFVLIKSKLSVIVPVLPRRKSRRIKLYGISEGSKVKLVQSGGIKLKHANEIGEVVELIDMLPLSYHGGVKVKWPSGETSNHQLGADGKVDLVMVESHQYSYPVYLDHLPVGDLTQPFETLINLGDKVCVDLNLDTVQKIQGEFGGWNQEMEKALGEIGTVVKLDNRTCRVQYDTKTWWFYNGACRKVSIIEKGDRVKVIDDETKVKHLQGRHGGWNDDMKNILGDIGVVMSIDPDFGDLEVKFQNSTFLLNMSCCVKLYDSDTTARSLEIKPLEVLPRVTSRTPPLIPLPYTEDTFMLQPGIPSSDDEEESNDDSITEPQDDIHGSGGSAAESNSSDDDDDDDDDGDDIILHVNGMTVGVGLRVVRGIDWKWQDQDGGKGHLGTVVELGLRREDPIPQQCVTVQWDEGNRNTYRVGYENAYDLRVYDNAGLGVKHQIRCDGNCGEDEIMGFLWQCTICNDVNLCSQCYHSEMHEIKHPFNRIDSPGDEPVCVPKRQICQRNRVLGIFEGAKVVRGPDWRWKDQDGETEGEVIAVVNFSLDSDRDAAEVTWLNGHTNVYRLGYRGALDLKCMHPAQGGTYFPDHLPILKLPKEEEIPESAARSENEENEPDTPQSLPNEDDGRLKKGDRVHIGCDPDTLKAIQKSVGGWSENMVDCLGQEGEVILINNGNITVKFKSGRWTFNSMCLEKINPIQKDSVVQVDPDEWKVRRLQGSLWSGELKKVIGKKGLVKSVDENGLVDVTFGSMTYTFKSDCLTSLTGEVPDAIPEFEEQEEEEYQDEEQVTVTAPPMKNEIIQAPPELTKAVANGKTETIQKLVDENPELVNSFDGKTPVLHVAVIKGHGNVVEKLLELGADKEIRNEEDSTPLLTAVRFKHLECANLLIENGANVNAINNNNQTAIHLAVQNKDTDILKMLKSRKECNVNIKDKLGDSAVTDAINVGDNEILKIILEWPKVDLKFVNKQGFSPIHFAARKGELLAVRLILQKCPDALNDQKADGYSALHLAACMDHHHIADYLIHLKGIDLESRTVEEGLTPLHMACRYASAKTVMDLINAVQARSDKNAETGLFSKDKKGNNALHHCLMGKPEFMEVSRMQKNESKIDYEQFADRCKIINQLVRVDVPYNISNSDGDTALNIQCSPQLRDELLKCINEREQHFKSKPADARPKLVHTVYCKNCEEDGVNSMAIFKLKPCGCTLCGDCCGAKPKKCPNCNQRVNTSLKLG